MKKSSVLILLVSIICASSVMALPSLPTLTPFTSPVMGESDFIRPGETARVDWVVTNTDVTASQGYSFDFAHGSSATFAASNYFYFYQLENTTSSNINTLTLNINPANVTSAGFIASVNLDSPPFSHSLSGEVETAIIGPMDPLGTTFSIPGVSFVSWVFIFPSLLSGEFSTVLFLTSNLPPEYMPSIMDAGAPALAGTLPAPPLADPPPIPEPISVLLIGSAVAGLLFKRK
ncbi:hypothetical protein KDK77_07575 [bacterium]|nr:hypothetical protein [bacterium]